MKQGTLRDLSYRNKFETDKKRTNSINKLVEKEEEREEKREETELSSREYKNIKDYIKFVTVHRIVKRLVPTRYLEYLLCSGIYIIKYIKVNPLLKLKPYSFFSLPAMRALCQ